MDFVCKLYGNTYAVHVTVALVGVATLNLALPAPPAKSLSESTALTFIGYCKEYATFILQWGRYTYVSNWNCQKLKFSIVLACSKN